jgi:hypothetical protein
MIYTSYYDFVKDIRPQYLISISGIPPDCWAGEHIQKLSPYTFFMKWKYEYVPNHTVAEAIAEYRRLFGEKVLGKLDPISVSKQIGENKILCCFEKNGSQDAMETFCHRHIVADWLKNNKIQIQELTVDTKKQFTK